VLAIGLLLVLCGLVVLNVGGMLAGHKLQEGAGQFETALRLARAESANTGRKIRLEFDPAGGACKITCEASPLDSPGVFSDYFGAQWARDLPNEMVTFTRCQLTGASAFDVLPAETLVSRLDQPVMAAITFYPDGSSDSAVIELRGRDAGDARTAVIQLDGVNGLIDTQILTDSQLQDFHQAGGTDG